MGGEKTKERQIEGANTESEKLGQHVHPVKLLARRASKMHRPFFFPLQEP